MVGLSDLKLVGIDTSFAVVTQTWILENLDAIFVQTVQKLNPATKSKKTAGQIL